MVKRNDNKKTVKVACGNCMWFQPRPDVKGEKVLGHCHLKPAPLTMKIDDDPLSQVAGHWVAARPLIMAADYCASFQPRPEQQERTVEE